MNNLQTLHLDWTVCGRMPDPEPDEPAVGEPDWSKPSQAVVVGDGDEGWVMFYVGAALDVEIDALGTRDAEDLGIMPPSAGIWVWIGKYTGGGMNWSTGAWDVDPQPRGDFRPPTDREWEKIRAGENPWDPDDWTIKPEDIQ